MSAPQPQAPVTGGVDISGPCDEAEHANDPRCTGVGATRVDDHGGRVDNSGPGNAEDRFDDDGGFDDDDNSGPGHGGDDGDDDSSGHGGGNSGHGGGDDD